MMGFNPQIGLSGYDFEFESRLRLSGLLLQATNPSRQVAEFSPGQTQEYFRQLSADWRSRNHNTECR